LRTREKIEDEIKPLSAKLKEANSLLGKATSKLGYEPENPEKELEELRQKKEQYDRNLPIAKLRDKLEADVKSTEEKSEEQQNLLSKTEEAIQELNYSETEHEKKENTLERQTTQKNDLEKIIEGKKSEKKTADTEAKNRDIKLEKLKEKAKEKKSLDNFIKLLNSVRKAYGKDGIQKMIRARAGPLLERATRDFFERFNLAYSDIKLDDDYNISVIGPAGEQDIDQISGGERVSLAIALRLAIAQVLSGRVETIIMDEPTTHLDEIRRKELVNILNSFFREGGRIIPQMLIISHHREIEDVADVIYSVKKEDEYSIVKTGLLE
jgi:exonuclease SbcC